MKKYVKIPSHIPLSVISEAVTKFLSAQKLVESTETVVEKILNKMNAIKTDADDIVELAGLDAFIKGHTAETISDETVKASYLKTVIPWLARNAKGAETTLEQLLNVVGLFDLLPEVTKYIEDSIKAESEQIAQTLPENPSPSVVLPEALPLPEETPTQEPSIKNESVSAVAAFMDKDKTLTEAALHPDSAIKKIAVAHFKGNVKAAKAFVHIAEGTPNYDLAVKALEGTPFVNLTDGALNNVLWLDVKEISSPEGEIVGDHIVKATNGSNLTQESELISKFIKASRLSKSEVEALAWAEAQDLAANEFVTVEKYDPAKIKAQKEEELFLAKVTMLKSNKIIGEQSSADLKTVRGLVTKVEEFQASGGKKVSMINRKELALAYEMLSNQISALNTQKGLMVAKDVE